MASTKKNSPKKLTKSSLNKMKKDELLKFAKENKIQTTSKMTKPVIIDAILNGQKSSKSKKEEITIEKSKYNTSKTPKTKKADTLKDKTTVFVKEDESYLVLMPQNPFWCFSYWKLSDSAVSEAKQFFGKQFQLTKLTIRIYNISRSEMEDRSVYYDIPVNINATSWYINIPQSGQEYKADIGFKYNHRFFILANSNQISIPSSQVKDAKPFGNLTFAANQFEPEQEQKSEEDIINEQILALSAGLDAPTSAPSSESLVQKVLQNISSQVSSAQSPQLQKQGQPGENLPASFWYYLECELIVKGYTLPDAKVFLNDHHQIELDSEGKFTLKFFLEDNVLKIKTKAVSKDEQFSKTITPIVTKYTQYD